ncbi:hypothetical protein BT63DRAFT_421577 [Microthyrium microscopicum]|uniref:Uncharacterized protein n=1 Tax=Microthyrium microscopicum TaxID=703497 RepID=A0A6A6UMB8_9PEZI|nr:hypothetical protein BT63DRAFT_421577 [Microthyrium microscopicum]
MYSYTIVTLGLLAITNLVSAHGAIVKAVGDAGGAGSAIGIDPNTPRDGTRRNPFQQDSTRFKGDNADTCGQTLGGGENADIAAGTKAVMAMMGNQLPQVSAGGSLMMTLHQVNGDGAGPYSCQMSADGTGAAWTDINVQTNVPGTNSRSRAKATDFPLKAVMPAQMSCTGNVAGQNNVCLVRCMNAARAGPFGGCVPVQAVQGGAAPAATNNTKRAENLDNDAEFQKELLADGDY